MTAGLADFEAQLKDFYADGRPQLQAYKNHPFLRLLRKRTDWTGYLHEVPVWYDAAQAIGSDFSTVINDKGAGKHVRFAIPQSKIYGVASIDRSTMVRSEGGSARAFLSAGVSEIDGVLDALGNDISHKIFRTRASVRGRIGSLSSVGGTNNVVTLTNREDITHFSVGQRLVASDGSAAAGATVDTTVLEVAAVDRSAGTIRLVAEGTTTAANVATDWGADAATNNDYLHRAGDVTASSNTLGFAGLEAWCPATAPTSGDSFFGVDRSVDTDRLAGKRLSATGYEVNDALMEMGRLLYEDGKKMTHAVLNPSQMIQLVRELENKVVYDDALTKQVGTDVIKVHTGAGATRVFQDPACPVNVGWAMDASQLYLVSARAMPHIFDEDSRMLREASADAYEVRMGGYGNLACKQPGSLGRIAFS